MVFVRRSILARDLATYFVFFKWPDYSPGIFEGVFHILLKPNVFGVNLWWPLRILIGLILVRIMLIENTPRSSLCHVVNSFDRVAFWLNLKMLISLPRFLVHFRPVQKWKPTRCYFHVLLNNEFQERIKPTGGGASLG